MLPGKLLFDNFLDDMEPRSFNKMMCDVYEEDNDYIIEVDVPGFEKENIKTFEIVFNNCFEADGYGICGSRGWFPEKESDKAIVNREAGRLRTSLWSAVNKGLEPIVFMHYPPVLNGEAIEPIFSVLKEFNIGTVYHGHIHGSGLNNSPKEYENITFKLISCDCIDFTPYYIK